MKIIEAISRIDDLKRNTFGYPDKVTWLSTLDSMVKRLVIDTNEGGEGIVFEGYTAETDPETELLVYAPFDEVYLKWLEAQMDYANREYDSYNNAVEAFNTAWTAYKNDYNRTHMPKGRGMKYF